MFTERGTGSTRFLLIVLHCVFQSHRELHRMKRLFFGPTNSTGIFNHDVSKAFAGVQGCVNIHNNILIYGRDVEEHNTNLRATLVRAKARGVTEAEKDHQLNHRGKVVRARIIRQCGISRPRQDPPHHPGWQTRNH